MDQVTINKTPLNKRFGGEADTHERAKKFVLDSFTIFANRQGLEDLWEKWDKAYNCITNEKFYEGTANLFPPETRAACRTLTNFVDETIFSADPKFQIKGQGGANDTLKAEAIYSLLDWQQEKAKVRMKLRKMLGSYLVKYGLAIVKVVWKVDEKFVVADAAQRARMKQFVAGEYHDVIDKSVKTIYDNVDFQVKDLHSMYWNYFKDWESQKIIIERNEVDESYLKLMARKGVYNAAAVSAAIEGKTGDSSKSVVESVAEKYSHIQDITGLSGDFNSPGRQHEILEAWCNFDLDGDGIEEECLITILDKEYVVRSELNPYDIQEKPYLWVPWESIEGTSLGCGVPQLAERSQIALNDFTNQIMDNITAILDCMKVVDDLAEIPDSQLKSRPNGIIRSKTGVEAVKFLPPALTANEGLKAVQMAKEDIRNATEATMSLQGLPARYGTTASEYKQQGAAAARGVFAKVREIEDRIIKEFLRKAYCYDLQFMAREDFIRVLGEKAAPLIGTIDDPILVKEAIRGDYDFIPLGVTQLEDKIVSAQQQMNYFNLISKLPPGIVDIAKLAGKIWKKIGDGDNILLPQPDGILMAPQDENILMAQGERPQAKPMENQLQHIAVHQQAVLPPELEPLRLQHIAEHQAFSNQMQMGGQGQGGLPPQEQPRLAPDMETPGTAGMVPGLPQESF